FSSLGGWIATRSGGHYATLYTHIDEFVESLRVLTPTGTIETRRLPGSGAGPSPDRLFIGSEGILGVIVEAWMRLQDRPTFRASAAVTFADFAGGAAAARAIAQAGLYPANCRLLDPAEAATAGPGDGTAAVPPGALESAEPALDARMERALALAAARRGAELEQWMEIKRAASEASLTLGGTITHHHAVGRDHRPWYDRERPAGFAAALGAAKAALDPRGILNPGVLIDPCPT